MNEYLVYDLKLMISPALAIKLNPTSKRRLMQKWIAALLFISVAGCNSKESNQNFSTVDSNMAGRPDSVPRRLYLDSFLKDTAVRVVLDSPGPTINPGDTAYSNKR